MAGTDRAAQEKVMGLIKGMHIAMMATRSPDGKFRSRPMAVSDTEFDGHLYFLTGEGSGKVHDLETDNETIITVSDPHKSSYVSLRGTAEIITDKAFFLLDGQIAASGTLDEVRHSDIPALQEFFEGTDAYGHA